jgi:hypothetical protein
VAKIGLMTHLHTHPYYIQWLNNSGKAKVTHTTRIHFSIGTYHDYADCDVVPMQACSLLLGRPWELDTDAMHYGRSNKYTLVHNRKKINLLPLTPNEIVQCDCTGSNRRCSEPSSSTSRSPPIDLPCTSQKIGTHPTIITSLPPNSIDSWVSLEQKFHDYFYNGEVELRLSDLTSLRQKCTETVFDYLRQFREVRNWCYNLTIAEKDLADLAFAYLTPYLGDKLDRQEFSNTNQLMQCVVPYENHAKSSRFRDSANKDKEKHHINFKDEEADDEEGNEICVAEWAEKPRDKPILCSFLKPNGGQSEEMRYTFDVSKCDHLFDLLLQGGVIRLTKGDIIPNADILAKKTYCKWHNSYTHTTNECKYFRR